LVLLDTGLAVGVRKVVFSSSCAVYGIPGGVPVTEFAPRIRVNPYGVSKLFFENALEAYAVAYGMQSVSLRYFNAADARRAQEELGWQPQHTLRTLVSTLGLDPAKDAPHGDNFLTSRGSR